MKENGDPQLMAYMSENEVRLRGTVKDISLGQELVILTVFTNHEHKGRFYGVEHIVKIRKENKEYRAAAITVADDIVAMKGTIHRDKSIIPFLFYNETASKDGRFRLRTDEAAVFQNGST
jgi:hypothetical protein